MWRNTKALVALEGTTLPSRTLQVQILHDNSSVCSHHEHAKKAFLAAYAAAQCLRSLLNSRFTSPNY